MTIFYLDTSVAVHVLLGHEAAETWFDLVNADDGHQVVSSRILRTELTRVLRREGLDVARRAEVLDYVALVRMSEAILTIAESIAAHVKTLDAVHIASAIATGSDTVVVSHDANVQSVATNLGFETIDPIDDQTGSSGQKLR